jgi:pimeloyl-ACP methyl ester carboxylesterase
MAGSPGPQGWAAPLGSARWATAKRPRRRALCTLGGNERARGRSGVAESASSRRGRSQRLALWGKDRQCLRGATDGAEPVRTPGVELGCVTTAERAVVLLDDEPDAAVEDVKPLMAFVAVEVGRAAGWDRDAEDAASAGAFRADRLPAASVARRRWRTGGGGPQEDLWFDAKRVRQLRDLGDSQAPLAGLQATQRRRRQSRSGGQRAHRHAALKAQLPQPRANLSSNVVAISATRLAHSLVPTSMDHMNVDVPGGNIHLDDIGSGPLVLLIHGFPEGRDSWRHQLPALAAAGYRAVGIDVRGYGDSLRPNAVEGYRMLAHVADNVAVVHGLGAEHAAIIGHDWGSPIAAASALLRPDLFCAVGLLGVPYTPRGDMRPTEAFAHAGGTEEFYVSYFQQPGRAEAEIEADVIGWLRGFTIALDSEGPDAAGWFTVPAGAQMRDRLPTAAALPNWLTEDDLVARAATLAQNGLTGPLNRYRNVDRDWEDLAAYEGAVIHQPAVYIAGTRDSSTIWLADAIARQPEWLPGLDGVHLLDGAGHWIQQERPDEVNTILLDWLRCHHPPA